MPRASLAVLSAVHAVVLGWAAVVLPWASWTAFALFTAVVAMAHVATGVLAVLRHPRLAAVWRAQSVLSFAYLAYLSWGLLSSAVYVRALYSGLGDGVAAALVAAITPLVLFTVPLGAWGIAATGGLRSGRRAAAAASLALALAAVGIFSAHRSARGDRIADETVVPVLHAGARGIGAEAPPTLPPRSLHTVAPAICREAPRRGVFTVVATFTGVDGVETHCLQAGEAALLGEHLAALVRERARVDPIKIDLVTEVASVPHGSLVETVAVRPGMDGACAASQGAIRCLMPWQLVALGAFSEHQGLPGVEEARVGASTAELRQALGVGSAEALLRVATRSLVSSVTGIRAAGRAAPVTPVDAAAVAHAEEIARGYVLAAQGRDGTFKYRVDPYTGVTVDPAFTIARQSGTTSVLCELAPRADKVARAAVRRSLDMLAGLEQRVGPFGILRLPIDPPTELRIASNALPLAAFLRCRSFVGDRYDALLGRLARLLLAQQRSDGSFFHLFDATRAAPAQKRGKLYVDGQIILALTLLEGVARDDVGAAGPLPARAEIHDAVERAMRWTAEDYWPRFAKSLFFIEENWHCIAAEAALERHRHDGYERFCLDYIAFKRRFVHTARSAVHGDFVGGYGIGSVTPPHNTATAGFAEALAAALSVMRARQLDTTADEALMRGVLGFLVRNQWDENCWQCEPTVRVAGGFSEHMASPHIRIDYVQHAWAAIGHGGRAVGLLPNER